jgi:hypothetical protein
MSEKASAIVQERESNFKGVIFYGSMKITDKLET